MTRARRNLIDRSSTPYYHCMARCVRRAFLCGKDTFSGQDYEHRRQWVVDRLDALVSVFAIEVCAYAVMSNHYHVVLHINGAEAKDWSRDDVFPDGHNYSLGQFWCNGIWLALSLIRVNFYEWMNTQKNTAAA